MRRHSESSRTAGRALVLAAVCLTLVGCLKPIADGPDTEDGSGDIAARFRPHKDVESEQDQWIIAPDDLLPDVLPDAVTDAADDATQTDLAAVDSGPICGDGACGDGEWCGSCAADCGACPKICVPLSSLGCAPGLQCYPYPPDNICAAPGALAPGAACNAWNSCQIAALCVAGLCRSLCDISGTDSATMCKPGVPCEKLLFAGVDLVAPDLGGCKPGDACNTLTDVGCAPGKTCVPLGWLNTCTKAGSGGSGQACAAHGECLQGLLCIKGACRLRCSTQGGPPQCAATACTPVLGPDDNPVPGFVGWCQ